MKEVILEFGFLMKMKYYSLAYILLLLLLSSSLVYQITNYMSISISPEVAHALKNNIGVVALESTLITHGLPFPHNLETALKAEAIVRSNGCVPATIAIIEGVIRVGLSSDLIDQLARGKFKSISKVARRDIARVVSEKGNGSTTVSATMAIAHMAGIAVFATGGIGGVHRGAEHSFDISSDITELGRTPVLVVCSGAKSILDLPKTVELLETAGVPVLGYGTGDMPAFFTKSSGLPTSGRCDSPDQVAQILKVHQSLGLRNGLLLTCPIPDEFAAVSHSMEVATESALKEAATQKVSGRDVTPFILKHIHATTHGDSLKANVGLILNNCDLASKVAACLVKNTNCALKSPIVTVLGGLCVDTIAVPSDVEVDGATGSSYPGSVTSSLGGVGRNIAQAVAQLSETAVSFHSRVGADAQSASTLCALAAARKNSWMHLHAGPSDSRTAQYVALLNGNGSLCSAVADTNQLFDQWVFDESMVLNNNGSQLILVDSNLSESFITAVGRYVAKSNSSLWGDAVSVAKCPRLLPCLNRFSLIKVNLDELAVLAASLPFEGGADKNATSLLSWIGNAARSVFDTQGGSDGLSLLVTLGKRGAALVRRAMTVKNGFNDGKKVTLPLVDLPGTTLEGTAPGLLTITSHQLGEFHITLYSAPAVTNVLNSTGAGDTFIGAVAWANFVKTISLEQSVAVGLAAARMTLMSSLAVAEQVTVEALGPLIRALEIGSSVTKSKL